MYIRVTFGLLIYKEIQIKIKMDTTDYSCTFTVTATAKHITECICNISGWWAADVKGNSDNPGDIFTVRFGKTFSTFKITEFVTNHKIMWLVIDAYLPLFKDDKEWLNTQIQWNIKRLENCTEVTMTHIGLTTDKTCYSDCKKGWNFYAVESLKKLIVKGKGDPGTGIFVHIINGDKRIEGLLYLKNDVLPQVHDDYILIDVKATQGEKITAIHSAEKLNTKTFNADNLKGEYFMLIENKAHQNNELLKTINQIFNH